LGRIYADQIAGRQVGMLERPIQPDDAARMGGLIVDSSEYRPNAVTLVIFGSLPSLQIQGLLQLGNFLPESEGFFLDPPSFEWVRDHKDGLLVAGARVGSIVVGLSAKG
jgi:hypothetical protein